MSIKKAVVNQGLKLDLLKKECQGVCFTVSKRWVALRLTGWIEEHDETLDSIFMDLPGLVKNQNEHGYIGDYQILKDEAIKTSGIHGSTAAKGKDGLRSRKSVLDHILTVPGTYIYIATPSGHGDGHAVAFDTRNLNVISFFDPNQGQWTFTNENSGSIQRWWYDFWTGNGEDSGIDYKSMFKGGKRILYYYNIPPRPMTPTPMTAKPMTAHHKVSEHIDF